MKRNFFLLLTAIFSLFAFSVNAQFPAARFVKVQRVIDGDTFVLTTGERVRLLGIDTPELDSKIIQEKNLAIKATDLIKGYVEGKTIKLTFDRSLSLRGRAGDGADIFGRTLSYVWLTNNEGKDSLFIQAELLKAGLARILMYSKDKMYYHLFYNLRNTARKNKLGVWYK